MCWAADIVTVEDGGSERWSRVLVLDPWNHTCYILCKLKDMVLHTGRGVAAGEHYITSLLYDQNQGHGPLQRNKVSLCNYSDQDKN